ncbi:MAG TPA: outer membrane protein assembly factor BamB [Burkholderiaceae bacterium]|jgi:outer membrane assembly lipoprotein YfgL
MRASFFVKPALVAVAVILSGCSLFSTDGPKLAPLEAGIGQGTVKVLWNTRIDGPEFPLSVVAHGDQFLVAGNDGVLQSLAANDGHVVWRADVGRKLTAGVGSDGRFSAVVTRDNELVVLDGSKITWRQMLNTPVVTAPFVAGERIFVLTVDRQVQAFDAIDGSKLFVMQRPGDALTLAKEGVLGAYQDTLIVGQGQRLTGVDPLRGIVRWEASLANPRGTNEVERLADLVGPSVRVGSTICARAFQSAIGCANAERGAPLWIRNTSGNDAIGGDAEQVYGGDSSDRLTAYKIANGDTVWLAEQFLNRQLGTPLSLGKTVMVGDMEGWLHFVDRTTGKTVARVQTDGSPILVTPVLLGKTALVVTKKGGVYAIQSE